MDDIDTFRLRFQAACDQQNAAMRTAQEGLTRIWRELHEELVKDVARAFDRLSRRLTALPAEPEVTRGGMPS